MKKIITIAAMSVVSFADCQEPLREPQRSSDALSIEARRKFRLPFANSSGESLLDKELRKKIIEEMGAHLEGQESILYPPLRLLHKSSDDMQKSQNVASSNTSASQNTPVKKNKRKKIFRKKAISQALFGKNDFVSISSKPGGKLSETSYVENWPESKPQSPDHYDPSNQKALTPEQIRNVRSLFGEHE